MPRVPKLPNAAQAWATLGALTNQADDEADVRTASYIGPIPTRVIAAALLDINARIAALEGKKP